MTVDLWFKILVGTLAGIAALIVTFRLAFTKPTIICGRCQNLKSRCQCDTLDGALVQLADDWLAQDSPVVRDCGALLRKQLDDRPQWSPLYRGRR